MMNPKNAVRIGAGMLALWLALAAKEGAAQECQVRIGVAGPMSGGAAAFGINTKLGADFQAALINEAGGLQMGDKKCKVAILGYDSMYTSAGGAAAANYFGGEFDAVWHRLVGHDPALCRLVPDRVGLE